MRNCTLHVRVNTSYPFPRESDRAARVDRPASADPRNWISIHVMPGIASRRWDEMCRRIFWCLYLDRRAIIAIRCEAEFDHGWESIVDPLLVAMELSGKQIDILKLTTAFYNNPEILVSLPIYLSLSRSL